MVNMKYNNFLFVGFLILLFSMVFAASPVITGPTTATREYIGADYNYYDFNVIWRSGVVTDADLDFDITSCMMSNDGGRTFYNDTPTVDWNADTNQCQTTLDYEWGVTDLAQIIFRVSDEADNNTDSPDMNWYLDNTAPTTVGTFNELTELTLIATDDATTTGNGVGVKRIYYSIDDGEWTSVAASTATLNITTPGSHRIYFYSTDNFDNNEMRDNLSGNYWDKPFTVPGISPTGGTCSLLSLMIMALAVVLLLSLIYAAFNVLTDGFNSQVFVGLAVSALTFIIILIVIAAFNSIICAV